MNLEGYRLQRDVLGKEDAVYPGHAVTLALLIVHAFDSLEAAEAKGRNYPAALGSHLIPGAGGNVYGALGLLRWLKGGMGWGLALKAADDAWASCDGQFGTDRWRKGQEQADRLKMALHDRVGTWLGIKGPLPA
jgi:hypothetical protein